MRRLSTYLFTLFLATGLLAEVRTLTLSQALDLALKQNPDLTLTRLDEQKVVHNVQVARDPFTPRLTAGSGLAYVSGFPLSIDGSAPSVVQARASESIFNRQQSYQLAQARENARGAGIATSAKRDEIAFKTASLYLDVQRAERFAEIARKQVESMEKVAQTIQGRVGEGHELPIESKRAALAVARARQRAAQLADDQDFTERSLALVLGFAAEDSVRPTPDDLAAPEMPASEGAAITTAVESSKELRRLESAILAKGLEIRGQKAGRLPRVDLVAQYGLFAKYSHYEEYFRTFKRNNGEIGVSIQIPLLAGPAVAAVSAQAEADAAHLRTELSVARNRIALETRQAYQALHRAESARDIARLDLDVVRDQLSIVLAQLGEGRASLRQVEEARMAENDKWFAFYDAEYATQRARWDVLRQTGALVAALR
jgi:outer membrane protein